MAGRDTLSHRQGAVAEECPGDWWTNCHCRIVRAELIGLDEIFDRDLTGLTSFGKSVLTCQLSWIRIHKVKMIDHLRWQDSVSTYTLPSVSI